MKLIIGSRERFPGWESFDIVGGDGVDHVGDCRDLSRFRENSIETIYASHVLEHLRLADLVPTLQGWKRALQPGGKVMISVPDLNVLSRMFIDPRMQGEPKFMVMSIMFGGQLDEHDFHHVGFDFEILGTYLAQCGYETIVRVPTFGLFDDTSSQKFFGAPISLNVAAQKPTSSSEIVDSAQTD